MIHNEVIIFTVENEQHQRCVLCSFATSDEYIHSLLNFLLFFLGSSSLLSAFLSGLNLCHSLLADVGVFSGTHLHLGFLVQILFPIKVLLVLLSFFLRPSQYLDTAGAMKPITGSKDKTICIS